MPKFCRLTCCSALWVVSLCATLLFLGCGKSEEDKTTSKPEAAAPQTPSNRNIEGVNEIRPEFPELNAMDWDYVLVYTLKNNLPVTGYLPDVRAGVNRKNGLEKLREINLAIKGNWGPYHNLVVEKVVKTTEATEGTLPIKALNSALLHLELLKGKTESMAAQQLAWSALINERLYGSALYLVAKAFELAPDSKETEWLAQRLETDLPEYEDVITRLQVTRNEGLGRNHPRYTATGALIEPLRSQDLEPDRAFELQLTQLPLVRNKKEIVARIQAANEAPSWQKLRFLQDSMEEFYLTRRAVTENPNRLVALSIDDRTDLLRIRNYLMGELQK